MKGWRLIMDGARSGDWNMSIDYALLKSVSRGEPPALRLYRWKMPSVTIGYFQMIRDEVFIENCGRDGVPVIRRITGGGAVYHDAEITYSVSIPLEYPEIAGTIIESYEKICRPIIASMKELGINARFSPINDILADGQKISGNAQTRREGVLLQHGTILLDLAPESMFSYLNVHQKKGKGEARGGGGVTSMTAFLGERATSIEFIADFNESLAESFAKEFNADFKNFEISDELLSESDIIRELFFNNREWNFKR